MIRDQSILPNLDGMDVQTFKQIIYGAHHSSWRTIQTRMFGDILTLRDPMDALTNPLRWACTVANPLVKALSFDAIPNRFLVRS